MVTYDRKSSRVSKKCDIDRETGARFSQLQRIIEPPQRLSLSFFILNLEVDMAEGIWLKVEKKKMEIFYIKNKDETLPRYCILRTINKKSVFMGEILGFQGKSLNIRCVRALNNKIDLLTTHFGHRFMHSRMKEIECKEGLSFLKNLFDDNVIKFSVQTYVLGRIKNMHCPILDFFEDRIFSCPYIEPFKNNAVFFPRDKFNI
jgi:hypothetical protein